MIQTGRSLSMSVPDTSEFEVGAVLSMSPNGDCVGYCDVEGYSTLGVVTEINSDTTLTISLDGFMENNSTSIYNSTVGAAQASTGYHVATGTEYLFSAAGFNNERIYELSTDRTIIMGNEEWPELIKLCENGDIIIKGRKIDNDICLVDAMRELLSGQGLYNR